MRTTLLRDPAARAVIGISYAVAVLFASPDIALAQDRVPLVGVWGVVSTPRNCATNAVLGPPVRSVVTFHQDGTSLESAALLLFAPGQRSVGHGTWTQTGVTFTERTLTLIAFETPANTPPGSPGFPAGWTVSTQTITLVGGDRFESTGRTQFFDLNRLEYRPPTCATRAAERFQ